MFWKGVGTDNLAIPNKILSGEKNYEIKPLHIMLLIFLLKMMNYQKLIELKKDLWTEQPTTFETKIEFYD